jgi:hypothetical protein
LTFVAEVAKSLLHSDVRPITVWWPRSSFRSAHFSVPNFMLRIHAHARRTIRWRDCRGSSSARIVFLSDVDPAHVYLVITACTLRNESEMKYGGLFTGFRASLPPFIHAYDTSLCKEPGPYALIGHVLLATNLRSTLHIYASFVAITLVHPSMR